MRSRCIFLGVNVRRGRMQIMFTLHSSCVCTVQRYDAAVYRQTEEQKVLRSQSDTAAKRQGTVISVVYLSFTGA